MSTTESIKYTKISQIDKDVKVKKSTTSLLRIKHLKGTRVLCNVDVWKQRYLNSHLLGAIYDNNHDSVMELLQEGANPNSTCRTYKFTAVHLAVLTASENILILLIQKGAKVNGVDRDGLNPLHYAAWKNRSGCIEILLEYVPKIEISDYLNLKTGTLCAVIHEYMKDSLDHKCCTFQNELPVNIAPGSTALHIACQNLHFKCVETLLEKQPDLNVLDERGLSYKKVIGEQLRKIENNSESNFIKIIKLLQNNEIQENAIISCNYFTPLHAAVILRSKEGIKILMSEPGASLYTFDHYGQTAIHLAIVKKLEVPLVALLECIKDVSVMKNAAGITPFQTAVENQWIQGIGLLLNANANVAEVAADGGTVLHVAASSGNVEFLEELLELEQIGTILDAQNNDGETPLFSAVASGNVQCVEALLDEGVDIDIKLNGNINILHKAAQYGNVEVLLALLKVEDELKLNLMDETDTLPYKRLTPLHTAVLFDNVECVKELLKWGCDYKKSVHASEYSGYSVIHLACTKGNVDVVEALLKHDSELLWSLDDKEREPLHCAALYGQRQCIELLLNSGADLSSKYNDETALDIIYRNISRPTEFLETIFDNAIKIDNKETLITDTNCMIKINFSLLMPKEDNFNQMIILSNMLLNGKELEQRKLLIHPLIESFLYLKWNKMSKIFWTLLILYALFVIVLTIFVVSLFYYKDENRPYILSKIEIIRFIMITLLLTAIIPEILLASQKLKQYSINIERIIKWSSFILVGILMWSHRTNHQDIWLRHVAAIAILTSWIEMMFVLSKIPTWGYYVQMFYKVSSNVIKVMMVFSFLVIGFALAFMIEFPTTEPFSDPLASLIKTIVMMTSELDYSGLFTGENKDNAQVINLTIYVIFLMLGTIVLMNLLVGLAVSDIHDLEIIGKIDRHSQQINFLSILEGDTFARFLPERLKLKLIRGKCVPCALSMYPSNSKCNIVKILPQSLKENLIDIAEDNFLRESEVTNKHLCKRIDELMKMIQDLNTKISKNVY